MRYEIIDSVKGVAVVLMVFFHIFYMMNNMGFNKYDSSGLFLRNIAKISHLTFIVCAGINLYLSYKNNKDKQVKDKSKQKCMKMNKNTGEDNLNKKKPNTFYGKKILRSLKLLFYGMIITVITKHVWGNKNSVKFGILHFMSVAIMLSLVIFKFSINDKILNIVLLCVIALFTVLGNSNLGNSAFCKSSPFLCFILGAFGKYNNNIGSLDHHSIFQKYPFFAIGIMIGKMMVSNKKKTSDMNKINNKNQKLGDSLDKFNVKSNKINSKLSNKIIKILNHLGKNSLNVYLIHWFILYGIIYLFGGRPVVRN